MTTTNFFQKARHALVPMRKALIDAILLGTLAVIVFLGVGFRFTSLLLLIPVYGLVFLIAFVIRLRKAATDSPAGHGERQLSPIDYTAYTVVQAWSRKPTRTPPEVY